MTQSSATTPLDTVLAYHEAWTGGDLDGAFALVAPDITCQAPGQKLAGIEAYSDYIGGFAPMLTGIKDIATFTDGHRVALFYYPQTEVTATTPAAECFTVHDGVITESVLIFDRLSYAPADQQSRAGEADDGGA
ncbi:nuclear transport factor 2 family protein [Arthrobacter castelli]|uniref:nuclear transport factor 2 family protein n=1 Tax=Arthrobacter castelli TaxID=271431 RepID=UPI00041E9F3F|nr:nuclear transport factor 2 family protein [Arthrobacter castelli]